MTLPANVDLERSILGSAYEGFALPAELRREHFTSGDRRWLFWVIKAIQRHGLAVTAERVCRCLRAAGCGGQCVAERWVCEYSPVQLPIADVVARLDRLHRRRRALELSIKAQAEIEAGGIDDAREFLGEALAAIGGQA